MNILYNLLSLIFFGASAVLAYKFFENKLYLLLIIYLFLGNSYSGQDEVLFGLFNLGRHEYRFIPGLTLFSKDIVFLLGFFALLFTSKLRKLSNELMFESVARIFIILLIVNFFAKILFSYDTFDVKSIKTLMRWFSPIFLYYIIFYLFKKNQYVKLTFGLQLMLIATSIVFFLTVIGLVAQVEEKRQIAFGSVNVLRYPIPHAFALFVPFFLSVGLFYSKVRGWLPKLASLLIVPMFVLVAVISTYRSYTITLVLGVVFGLIYSLRAKQRASLIVFGMIGAFGLTFLINYLSKSLSYDVSGIGTERLFSSFQEVLESSGTGGIRIEIMLVMASQFFGSVIVFLFGKIFTLNLFDIYGANNDIGLMSTIIQGGVFFLIPIILAYVRVFRLVNKRYEDQTLETIRLSVVIYFTAIIPSMLFNFDYWFQLFLSQSVFLFMGLFDAIYYDEYLMGEKLRAGEEEEEEEPETEELVPLTVKSVGR